MQKRAWKIPKAEVVLPCSARRHRPWRLCDRDGTGAGRVGKGQASSATSRAALSLRSVWCAPSQLPAHLPNCPDRRERECPKGVSVCNASFRHTRCMSQHGCLLWRSRPVVAKVRTIDQGRIRCAPFDVPQNDSCDGVPASLRTGLPRNAVNRGHANRCLTDQKGNRQCRAEMPSHDLDFARQQPLIAFHLHRFDAQPSGHLVRRRSPAQLPDCKSVAQAERSALP